MAQWLTLIPNNVALIRLRSGAVCELILSILAMLPRLFPLFSGLPTSIKANIFKFQFDGDKGHALKPVNADAASFFKYCDFI